MKENVNKHCKVLFKDELLWDSVNNNKKKKAWIKESDWKYRQSNKLNSEN